jgi:hypothetical protein
MPTGRHCRSLCRSLRHRHRPQDRNTRHQYLRHPGKCTFVQRVCSCCTYSSTSSSADLRICWRNMLWFRSMAPTRSFAQAPHTSTPSCTRHHCKKELSSKGWSSCMLGQKSDTSDHSCRFPRCTIIRCSTGSLRSTQAQLRDNQSRLRRFHRCKKGLNSMGYLHRRSAR